MTLPNGTTVDTLEWVWRIASVIILPLLAWIALILRDIDRRLGKVEVRVEAIELGARDDRQIRRNEHRQSDQEGATLRQLRDSDREQITQIAIHLAEMSEAVKQLNARLDREAAQ
jgi:hypothetical protein